MYQNVTVITNSATAEYGGAGGGIVNLITKGGTNQFHGTAWELYSGSGINALDGQQRQLPHEHGLKSRFNQHQFGFTLGGPILKNKLFAFGGTQFSRIYGNETAAQNLLPDANGIATLQRLSGPLPNAKLLLALLDNGTYVGTLQAEHDDSGNAGGPGQRQRPTRNGAVSATAGPAAESRHAMDLSCRLAAASIRYDLHPIPARQHIVDAGLLQQSDVASGV